MSSNLALGPASDLFAPHPPEDRGDASRRDLDSAALSFWNELGRSKVHGPSLRVVAEFMAELDRLSEDGSASR
jgi:hypothetical protein